MTCDLELLGVCDNPQSNSTTIFYYGVGTYVPNFTQFHHTIYGTQCNFNIWDDPMLYLLIVHIRLYQVKTLMFYDVQTTSLPLLVKKIRRSRYNSYSIAIKTMHGRKVGTSKQLGTISYSLSPLSQSIYSI
jgi:hypothetical protein